MNHIHLIFGGILVASLSILHGCEKNEEPLSNVAIIEYTQESAYRDMRILALGIKPQDLQLSDDTDQPLLVLMETGYPEAVVTLVSSSDGSASLYFSSGGGVIGAGEHNAVREVSISFLNYANEFKAEFSRTENYPLPKKGSVRFYLVMSDGIFTTEKVEDDLGHMRELLSPLFHKGHEVITAIRLASDNE